jgi:hypothetical protein
MAKVVNLNHPNVWVQVCEQCVALFKRVMPMVMENLVITQYLIFYGMWPSMDMGNVQMFELGHYICL